LAREYTDADVDRDFRLESLDTPSDATYSDLRKDNFRSYVMPVDGLVDRPQSFTLAHLRAIPQRTQITRHDCVEGWSQIGKWSGVPLATILAMVQPKPEARYVIYGSLDLRQAAHPQTLLSLDLNDKPLDPDHGAPVRLKVPIQLGYKSSKWVRKITLAATFKNIGAGNGGYWEDNGYAWYAGI
jgi:DMSO/TMAO reductase YedYZ molybdopterin-dependent catalytic subunit